MSQPPFNFAGAAIAIALQPLDLNESLLRPPPPAPVSRVAAAQAVGVATNSTARSSASVSAPAICGR